MEGGPKRRMTTEVHQTYPGRARAKGTITPTRVNRPHTPRPCRRGQHAPHHQACEAVQAGLDSPRALRTNAKALEHTAGTTVALRQGSGRPRTTCTKWQLAPVLLEPVTPAIEATRGTPNRSQDHTQPGHSAHCSEARPAALSAGPGSACGVAGSVGTRGPQYERLGVVGGWS